MRAKRKEFTTVFCLELFGGGILAAQFYRNLAFKCIPGHTLAQSNFIFWSLVIGMFVSALLITPPKKRNKLTVFALVNTPVTIYYLISYFHIFRTPIILIVGILLVCIICYSALVAWFYILARRNNCYYRVGPVLRMYLHRCGMITGLSLSVVFLILYFYLMLGGAIVSPNTEAEAYNMDNQQLSNNVEELLLLQEEIWADLSVKERLDVLQTVANYEVSYLGLPHELNVSAEVLDEGNLGCYIDSIHSIKVNLDFLSTGTAHELLETLAHEVYHAYQHRLVDLYNSTDEQYKNMMLLYRASVYKEEFESYVDGDEDFIGYLFQVVEIDSDAYALATVDSIYKEIDEYLSSGK